jgi:hypothetical protein
MGFLSSPIVKGYIFALQLQIGTAKNAQRAKENQLVSAPFCEMCGNKKSSITNHKSQHHGI